MARNEAFDGELPAGISSVAQAVNELAMQAAFNASSFGDFEGAEAAAQRIKRSAQGTDTGDTTEKEIM